MTGWALVKDFLLLVLPNLDNLDDPDAVWDGAAMSQGDLRYVAEVGRDDETNRGTYEQTDEDYFTAETGEVLVRFTARSGDTDLEPLEDTVEGWVDTLRQTFRSDKTLGGTLTQSSTVNVGRVEKQAAQTGDGAIVRDTVAIRYSTRL